MSNIIHYVNLNGSILPESKAMIFPGQSGFYYGTGCFETFRADNGIIFRFDSHIQRLYSGLKYLGVPKRLLPSGESLSKQIFELLEANSLHRSDARVRIQISIDEREGYKIVEDTAINQLIETKKRSGTLQSAKLVLAQTRVVPSICKPAQFKLSNMLHYRNAYREAQKRDANDALMLTVNGHVAETSIANIFWKSGDEIFTPSKKCDLLPGIMRNTLIKILKEDVSLLIREGEYNISDIKQADLVWLTNSVSEIQPVKQIEEQKFTSDDSYYNLLRERLQNAKLSELET